MNTKLKLSAETGDIDLLYSVIQDDQSILEIIDKNQFVETPLHIAVSSGQLKFATEIMNLKPSFAIKLNMQGYSPIHLAMKSLADLATDNTIDLDMNSPTHPNMCILHGRMMVSKLVGINKDLVRVKGREGLTPLHWACQIGELDLLAEFLTACPDSIEDVTASGESALHIAVNNYQFYVLRVLVGWLKENCQRGARRLEEKILNLKDDEGNTVLHISAARRNDPEYVRFLAKTGQIKLNAKNLRKETALDLATTSEIMKILIDAKAKHGSDARMPPTRAAELSSNITSIDNIICWIRRTINDITDEERNTWLVVATLVATATFESALNPPGGVFQVSASDDKNVKVSNTYDFFSIRGNAGKSILSRESFMIFSLANMLSFCVSIIAILILTPGGAVGRLVIFPVSLFVWCYLIAMPAISPTHTNTTILYIPMYSIVFLVVAYFIYIKCNIIWERYQIRIREWMWKWCW